MRPKVLKRFYYIALFFPIMNLSRTLLWALIAVGVGLRILYSTMSVDVSDAYFNVVTAKTIKDCHCLFPTIDSYGMSKIFRPFGGVIFMALFMPYPIIGVLLGGIALIILTYFTSRKLGLDYEGGLVAAAAVSLTPLAVSLSSTHSIDTFNALYLLSALNLFIAGRMVWSSLFCALGIYTNFVASLFVPAPFFTLIYQRRWAFLGLFSIIFFLAVLPLPVWLWNSFENPVYPYFASFFGHMNTEPVGHRQALLHYILGLPLSLFGVPEGNHYTVLSIATSLQIPPLIVWSGLAALFFISLILFLGVWRLSRRLSPEHRMLLTILFISYGLFYAIRIMYPMGSDVLDLRYFLLVIPFIGMGITTFDPRIKWTLLFILLLGSTALYERFALAKQAFAPYEEALDEVRKLPHHAVVLSDQDSSVFAYGISYDTGRQGFPYVDNPTNIHVHIPYLVEAYDAIKSKGPNYLWTTNFNRTCEGKVKFENSKVRICALPSPAPFLIND